VTSAPATSAQNAAAESDGWGGLASVQIATDTLSVAVDAARTNAPAGLSVDELNGIYSGYYQTWNQLPGNSGGSADAIIPELPSPGTPFYPQFLDDIGNPTLGSDVQVVNADDPTAIAGASDPADAIVPFSTALASLYASGYFPDPNAPYPGSPDRPGIRLLAAGAIAPDGDLTYQGIHGIYVVFRQSDAASTTPWQPGGTENWADTLFLSSGVTTPYYDTAAAQADLLAAGLTPAYYPVGAANPNPDEIGTQPAVAPANLNDVLVATGDSVTSAQNQYVSGIPGTLAIPGVPPGPPCPNISADQRRMTGDDGRFSYAGRYFGMSGTAIQYWNFARTGYGTGDMLNKNPPPDACGNAWTGDALAGGVKSPADSAAAVIKAARAAGYNAYYVTTGGVNNTNWTTALGGLAVCRAWADATTILSRYSKYLRGAVTATFKWGFNGEQGIFPKGSTCSLTVAYPGGTSIWTQKVPKYDGLAGVACSKKPGGPELSCVNADATTIVNKELTAGADKVVWMQYYDMTLANVDVGPLLWAYLKSVGYFAGVLPAQPPRYLVPLLDPIWQSAAKNFIDQLNVAIFNGLNSAASPKVKMGYPAIISSRDIQATGIGGSPHPDEAGQQNMAIQLRTVLSQLPLPARPAARGAITEYSLPQGSQPTCIGYGSDGNLWVSEPMSGRIAVVSVNGNSVQLFLQRANIINPATGTQTINNTGPAGITAGPDGNMWLAEKGAGVVAKISPSGAVTEIPLPAKGSGPTGIVADAGSLWVTETKASKLAKITPATGAVIEYPLPGSPAGLTVDANGHLWVTEPGTSQVAEVNPANGKIIAQANLPAGSAPNAIALGSDGNLWVTEPGIAKVAVIKAATAAVTAQVALPAGANPAGITRCPFTGSLSDTPMLAGV
jgi:streptogramin lyase